MPIHWGDNAILLSLWLAHSLVSALAITAYFIVGSRYQERKLGGEFGDAYRDYAKTVPGLLPSLWPRSSRHAD